MVDGNIIAENKSYNAVFRTFNSGSCLEFELLTGILTLLLDHLTMELDYRKELKSTDSRLQISSLDLWNWTVVCVDVSRSCRRRSSF